MNPSKMSDTFLVTDHLLRIPEGERFGHTDILLTHRGLKRSLERKPFDLDRLGFPDAGEM